MRFGRRYLQSHKADTLWDSVAYFGFHTHSTGKFRRYCRKLVVSEMLIHAMCVSIYV